MSEDTRTKAFERWAAANEALHTAQLAVSRHECELSNATTALGRAVVPSDAKVGEVYRMWFTDQLVSVEVSNHGRYDYVVTVREKPPVTP